MTPHNVLYILPDGSTKSSGSYSARDVFKFCKRKFYLQRVRGWNSRRQGAALDFGKIVEEAVKHQIINGVGGREKFVELWTAFKATPDFGKKVYAKAEVSWDNMLRIGEEWMQIFALRQKTYPLDNPEFQVPLSKKFFPGTSYGNLVNIAYLDITARVDQRHPMLTKLKDYPPGLRNLIIDVKTASRELQTQLVSLDPQLIEYAWMKQWPDVGFLWFVKKSHGVKFKSRVTLLVDYSPFKAGTEVYVLEKEGANVWVTTLKNADLYAKRFLTSDNSTIKGKAADAISAKFLASGYAVRVPLLSVSKQLVQFATARLSQQAMDDMGKIVGQTTVEMVVAHEQDFYPMEPGIRYPSEKCPRCDMRAICSNDREGVERFLVRGNNETILEGDMEDLEEFSG